MKWKMRIGVKGKTGELESEGSKEGREMRVEGKEKQRRK